MIRWTEIDNEVETFQEGYRSGFVTIFKKYEGQETDEKDAQGRIVKVSATNFAGRYGIPDRTFRRWVSEENGHAGRTAPTPTQRIAEAAAQAKAEAAAEAAIKLAEALDKQKAEAEKAMAVQRAKAEAQAARAATEAKAQLEEAKRQAAEALAAEQARMKQEKLEALGRLEKQLKEEAKNQGFDLTQLSDSDKAKVMSLIGNDPAQAKEWFRAYDAERARKNDEAMRKAQEEAERRKQSALDKEAKEAARKASLAYDDSPLHFYLTKLYPQLLKFEEMMKEKPITFDTIVYSRMAPSQIVPKFDRGEDIICAGREAIFQAQVQNELAEIFEED